MPDNTLSQAEIRCIYSPLFLPWHFPLSVAGRFSIIIPLQREIVKSIFSKNIPCFPPNVLDFRGNFLYNKATYFRIYRNEVKLWILPSSLSW
jgi:hypothetical protein